MIKSDTRPHRNSGIFDSMMSIMKYRVHSPSSIYTNLVWPFSLYLKFNQVNLNAVILICTQFLIHVSQTYNVKNLQPKQRFTQQIQKASNILKKASKFSLDKYFQNVEALNRDVIEFLGN